MSSSIDCRNYYCTAAAASVCMPSISVSTEYSSGMSANVILWCLLLSLCWDQYLMTFSNMNRASYLAHQNQYRDYVLSIVWAMCHSDQHLSSAARLYCVFGILMLSGFRCFCDGKNRNQPFSRESISRGVKKNNLIATIKLQLLKKVPWFDQSRWNVALEDHYD